MGSISRNLFLSFPVRFLQLDQLDTWAADGGTTNRLRAVRHARYEAVVRFAYPTGGRYRSHPFDGYQNALTEASGRGR